MNERRYRIEERAGNEVVWTREYATSDDVVAAFTTYARYRIPSDRSQHLIDPDGVEWASVGPDHCVLPAGAS